MEKNQTTLFMLHPERPENIAPNFAARGFTFAPSEVSSNSSREVRHHLLSMGDRPRWAEYIRCCESACRFNQTACAASNFDHAARSLADSSSLMRRSLTVVVLRPQSRIAATIRTEITTLGSKHTCGRGGSGAGPAIEIDSMPRKRLRNRQDARARPQRARIACLRAGQRDEVLVEPDKPSSSHGAVPLRQRDERSIKLRTKSK